MKKTLAALLLATLAIGLAACDNTTIETTVATTTEVITVAETTEAVTTAEQTTALSTAEVTTEAVITTAEVTVEATTEATTVATTEATTVATTEVTTVATTEVTTEATTVATTLPEETTTVPEETTAPKEPEVFSFEESDLSDYVLLGKYIGIEVHIPAPAPVSDEEVEEQIDAVIETLPPEAMLYTRACVEGDKVNINFVGTMDGVAFEGGSAENTMLVLGEGRFIPGFEEGIMGMIPGDVLSIKVVFPDNYYEELAGKEAQFEITLNYIYPKITDEIAVEYFGYDSVAAVRADVRASLEAEAREALYSEKESAAWTKVLANSSVVVYPEEAINWAFEKQVAMYKELAASYNMTYEELFAEGYGIAVDEAESILREAAKNSVKQQLVLYSIAREKGITLDNADYEPEMLALAESYGLSTVDELLSAIGYSRSELKEVIIYMTIVEEIIENANFVETN